MIGFLGLWVDLIHSEAWVGIGIGEREFWSKGYGTDMMKLCLQYAFFELGVQRLSLGLHEYNPRALRSYEKAAFGWKAAHARMCCAKANAPIRYGWASCVRNGLHMQNGENSNEGYFYAENLFACLRSTARK